MFSITFEYPEINAFSEELLSNFYLCIEMEYNK